ncbi:hypothetical protein CEXT_15891 [Caerostris extrusa]|uniref:Uncharacterized protein n=1 Tax=Caerostris extrusa TaxID=172846 RepID=A0AAV4UCQ6_CAEEX|nr:hypothetical protein CEXT_15891 [Caerostris extrusa]
MWGPFSRPTLSGRSSLQSTPTPSLFDPMLLEIDASPNFLRGLLNKGLRNLPLKSHPLFLSYFLSKTQPRRHAENFSGKTSNPEDFCVVSRPGTDFSLLCGGLSLILLCRDGLCNPPPPHPLSVRSDAFRERGDAPTNFLLRTSGEAQVAGVA